MLWIFYAGPPLFRTGWFVESLATQTLVVFAIRTRRVPFFRSGPAGRSCSLSSQSSPPGAILPETAASALGFQPLPGGFFLTLVIMVACYLALIEVGKRWFYRAVTLPAATRPRRHGHRLGRRAARFSIAAKVPQGEQ